MKYAPNDTIVAVATPMGIGALLILRLSGAMSIPIVDSVFHGRKKLTQVKSHTIHYGEIKDKNCNIIDDVLVSVFRAPHSFTGEDSCEISCHGNPLIAQKMLQLFVEHGVRLADRGEFTKRAFLNGRLDLVQAEAVVDVIEASTTASLRGARNQLNGLLSSRVEELRNMLLEASSLLELELDFSEEDVEFIERSGLQHLLAKIIREIDFLLDSYRFGRILKDGINVALVGKPNVGKSSLLNYLLKESRAIVSSIPGTTRDVIREEFVMDGILFRLFDTAGLRETHDVIEKEGVERSFKAVKESDLVIFLNEAPTVDIEIQKQLLNFTDRSRIIIVLNKIDIVPEYNAICDIAISAKTGQNMNELCNLLYKKSLGTSTYTEDSVIVTNVRHYESLQRAKKALQQAQESVNCGRSAEFVSLDLRDAGQELGEIIGAVSSDDILNSIFSRFCIGK
ncbi:MAG: tRNA uridine-5-carboxymethylaminomethyl(34) synthesis GTPase MnmE [Planctomycetes bacterium]|jgi:tRNA modification GTPase|nr:tRNA uridine-5-carboxymethylaminomethyl(34) synthesis GTPase MnmE [Planctomycetota bacterium]HPY75473.1 tRNA uridine-5-carboxymethylaminomethyl(34) synthesis GTPase MnmE [Planctomycetota bacterium]HQB01359.1 tRNA uridine-5-carboxymethylaminomethyl(34) synthesis GTPase MnmE [Planctomycetota bacterium]